MEGDEGEAAVSSGASSGRAPSVATGFGFVAAGFGLVAVVLNFLPAGIRDSLPIAIRSSRLVSGSSEGIGGVPARAISMGIAFVWMAGGLMLAARMEWGRRLVTAAAGLFLFQCAFGFASGQLWPVWMGLPVAFALYTFVSLTTAPSIAAIDSKERIARPQWKTIWRRLVESDIALSVPPDQVKMLLAEPVNRVRWRSRGAQLIWLGSLASVFTIFVLPGYSALEVSSSIQVISFCIFVLGWTLLIAGPCDVRSRFPRNAAGVGGCLAILTPMVLYTIETGPDEDGQGAHGFVMLLLFVTFFVSSIVFAVRLALALHSRVCAALALISGLSGLVAMATILYLVFSFDVSDGVELSGFLTAFGWISSYVALFAVLQAELLKYDPDNIAEPARIDGGEAVASMEGEGSP